MRTLVNLLTKTSRQSFSIFAKRILLARASVDQVLIRNFSNKNFESNQKLFNCVKSESKLLIKPSRKHSEVDNKNLY